MSQQLKPATIVAQQIDILRGRGMDVDAVLAEQWLMNVGYYRLSAYWYPARTIGPGGESSDNFKPGISFSDAVNLYEADRKLRTLIYDGIERIEVALRVRLTEQMCSDDPLRYKDPTAFRAEFDHARWIATVHKRIDRAMKRNESIRHYTAEYDGYYPFWVIAEILDFSDVSRMFEGMPAADQSTVAESFNLRVDFSALSRKQRRRAMAESPLARWFEQLTVLRNMCAHHSRVWNKSFTPASTVALRTDAQFATLPVGQSEKVYGALTVMAFLLRTISPGTSWPKKVSSLIQNSFFPNPLVTKTALGAPKDWDGTI